ncbi:MAG: carboxypeptidase-like regulatory domain-containing protein [Planctomycetaceae bacterium]|jgi:5-hydroxyisourate hydrolase-like protein (transthyretin family)|nr:carboxypeptidase-like regulatory domain-containing protein [Planctomycetaceae bacterium]
MKRLLLLLFLILAVFNAGCSRSSISGLVSGQGQVIYDGSPIGGVSVLLTPADGSDSDRFATAVTNEDGTFTLDTLGNRGVLPGKYFVGLTKTTTKSKISAEEEKRLASEDKPVPPHEVTYHIPYKYSVPATSGIVVEIDKSGKRDIRIELQPDNTPPPASDI